MFFFLIVAIYNIDELPDKAISNMMLTFGLSNFIRQLSLVPSSVLKAELKFRKQMVLIVGTNVVFTCSALTFAYLHASSLALIVGHLIASLVHYGLAWRLAEMLPLYVLRINRCRFLVRNAVLNFSYTLSEKLRENGDYLILGLVFSSYDLGLYYFAYTLSSQVQAMILGNAYSVIFPLISRDKLIEKVPFYLKLVTLVLLPLPLLQIVWAPTLVHRFYAVEWHEAISYIQILSFAMIFRSIGGLWPIVYKVQEKYLVLNKLSVTNNVFYLICICASIIISNSIQVFAYFYLGYFVVSYCILQLISLKDVGSNYLYFWDNDGKIIPLFIFLGAILLFTINSIEVALFIVVFTLSYYVYLWSKYHTIINE